MSRFLLAGSVAVLSMGCSDEPGSGGPMAGGAGMSRAGASSGGAVGSASGGVAGGLQAASGGAAAGSGGAALEPLVPLVTGRLATFGFLPLSSSEPSRDTCESPTAEVGEKATIEGHDGTLYSTPCGREPFLVEGSGDQLTAYRLEAGRVTNSYEYVHSPVAEGESWTTGNLTYEWRSVAEPVETPGGTFDECWERYASDLSIVYCRGIGLVRMTSGPSNYVLSLVSKNF